MDSLIICIGFIRRPGLSSAHLHCPHATMHAVADPSALQARLQRWSTLWPGLALAAAVAATAILAARLPALQALGMGALTLAIVFGIALGNSVFPRIAARSGAGGDLAKEIGRASGGEKGGQ